MSINEKIRSEFISIIGHLHLIKKYYTNYRNYEFSEKINAWNFIITITTFAFTKRYPNIGIKSINDIFFSQLMHFDLVNNLLFFKKKVLKIILFMKLIIEDTVKNILNNIYGFNACEFYSHFFFFNISIR